MRLLSTLAALAGIVCLTTSCSTVERVADYAKYRGEYHVRTVPVAKRTARHAESSAAAVAVQPATLAPATLSGQPAAAPVVTAFEQSTVANATAPVGKRLVRRARLTRGEVLAAPVKADGQLAAAKPAVRLTTKELKAEKGAYVASAPLGVMAPMAGDNQIVATILCFFFGLLGVHRFYLGYIWQGVVQLLTLGGLGIWTLIDFIRIIIGDLQPIDGSYNETF